MRRRGASRRMRQTREVVSKRAWKQGDGGEGVITSPNLVGRGSSTPRCVAARSMRSPTDSAPLAQARPTPCRGAVTPARAIMRHLRAHRAQLFAGTLAPETAETA